MGHQPGLFHLRLSRRVAGADCDYPARAAGAGRFRWIRPHRAASLGAGSDARRLAGCGWHLADGGLDDSPPAWRRLERVAHRPGGVRAGTEPQSQCAADLSAGGTRRVFSISLSTLASNALRLLLFASIKFAQKGDFSRQTLAERHSRLIAKDVLRAGRISEGIAHIA